jgi:hypothetical protein
MYKNRDLEEDLGEEELVECLSGLLFDLTDEEYGAQMTDAVRRGALTSKEAKQARDLRKKAQKRRREKGARDRKPLKDNALPEIFDVLSFTDQEVDKYFTRVLEILIQVGARETLVRDIQSSMEEARGLEKEGRATFQEPRLLPTRQVLALALAILYKGSYTKGWEQS